MKVDYATRGSGKTTRCVLHAIKNDCILVVPSETAKKLIEEKWNEAVKVGVLEIRTIDDYVRFRNRDKSIVIDNADLCLQILLGATIEVISIDNESKYNES